MINKNHINLQQIAFIDKTHTINESFCLFHSVSVLFAWFNPKVWISIWFLMHKWLINKIPFLDIFFKKHLPSFIVMMPGFTFRVPTHNKLNKSKKRKRIWTLMIYKCSACKHDKRVKQFILYKNKNLRQNYSSNCNLYKLVQITWTVAVYSHVYTVSLNIWC